MYRDIQNEVSQGTDLHEQVGLLGQKLSALARENQDYMERNQYSLVKGGDEEFLRRQIKDLEHQVKVLEKSSRAHQNDQLEKELDLLERENERLRRELSNMQDNSNHQMAGKDSEIARLYEQLDRSTNQEEL